MLLLVGSALAHVPFPRGTTTVTEIHTGPASEGGQWFEVRNDSASGQNLVEQVFTDADGDSFQVALTVIVRAGEAAVLASEDSTVDADYHFPAAFDLRAEAGAIVHTDLLGTVDEVRWDATWGVAGVWQVDVAAAANEWANDLAWNWCDAGGGTPGADNVACPGADTDDDGDGYSEEGGDCDDRSATVHPGAPDGPGVPDDGDCDGVRDDGAAVDTGDSGGDTASGRDTGADTDPGGDTGANGDSGRDTDAGNTGAGDTDAGDTDAGDTDTADTGSGGARKEGLPCGCDGGGAGLAWLAALFARRARRGPRSSRVPRGGEPPSKRPSPRLPAGRRWPKAG